jgi:ankyrin repeat protein
MTISMVVLAVAVVATAPPHDEIFVAVRAGDAARVKALLDQGVPVDAKARYDRTPLSFAAARGNVEIVRLLLERGADVKAKDTFYGATALDWAADSGNPEIARLLLAKGAGPAAEILMGGARKKNLALVEVALATGTIGPDDLSFALQRAEAESAADVVARLRAAGAVAFPKPGIVVPAETLALYAGTYGSGESAAVVSTGPNGLSVTANGRTLPLVALTATRFRPAEFDGVHLEFKVEGGKVTGMTKREPGSAEWAARAQEAK